MGGKVWSSEELDTLELLAGDVPWPALPQIYWNTVRQHGYPRRTGTALRRKCNDLGLQRAAIGRWVNAGLICQLMDISYEAVQTWMRSNLLQGKRYGSTKGHRYYFTRASLRALAQTHPHLFGGLPISNLTQLFDDSKLAARIAALDLPKHQQRRPVLCVSKLAPPTPRSAQQPAPSMSPQSASTTHWITPPKPAPLTPGAPPPSGCEVLQLK
jgi:DNA-binding transcriptional MerR regulator